MMLFVSSRNTLLAWDIGAILRCLEHSLITPFLGNEIYIDLFQSIGRSHVSHVFLHRMVTIFVSFSATFINSADISSISGDFPLEIFFIPFATSTSNIVGS